MTPCEELGYKVGDKFVVKETSDYFHIGEVVTLYCDDGTTSPQFESKDGFQYYERLTKFNQLVYVAQAPEEHAREEHTREEHPLEAVFRECLEQVTVGKGQRHGGNDIPFMEQPWKHYAGMHGRGFLTGQAAKKLEEAAAIKNGDEFIREVLGAIAYCGMAILYEKEKQK